MGGAQRDAGRLTGSERLLPARRTEAPAVARLQAGKTPLRHRRREIVAARLGEGEEFRGHDDANRMAAGILRAGVATSVAEEAGHWLDGAAFEPFAQDIARRSPPPAIAIAPRHGSLQLGSRGK